MNYTKEQLTQIEKVKSVFQEFITNSPDIDLIWSDKIGYVYFNGISYAKDEFIFEPLVIKDADMLCSQLLCEIAFEVLQSLHDLRDLHECGPLEQTLIEKACAPYMSHLPEYHHLIRELFINPLANNQS